MEQIPRGFEKNVVAEVLKTRGFEDVEAREMLMAWTEQREREVVNDGSRKAQVEFELDRASLYAEAGATDAARDTLIDLLDIVIANEPESEEMNELRNKAEEQLSSLGE